MTRSTQDAVHALELPTGALPLLLPSACIAEVLSPLPMTLVPGAPDWVLGVINWRSKPVSVVSVERLLGMSGTQPGPRAKMVVLYPLPGRKPWEFVAFMSVSEPQSRLIDAATAGDIATDIPEHPLIASALRLGRNAVAIPDFDALSKTFFP